ncbi:hypothetical protein BCR34DRAFT_588839 [Clohesyomyces aquaticus]|uniref:Uncharacterized protein n=1 Tax=Clohesyomyces aquaticus TaxID=1231657 RepID=A0A1Y1ZIV4_9PLEO|nr:hypothetical protein BCR34DRAFT_588839 [Clohesyomyces aquaticus]
MSDRGPPSRDSFTPDQRRLWGLDAHFPPNISAQNAAPDSSSLGGIKKRESSSSLRIFCSARLSPNTAPDIWDGTASEFAQSVASYGASGKKQYTSGVRSIISSDHRNLIDKLKSGARNVTGYRKGNDYVSVWKEKKLMAGTPSSIRGVKSDSDCGGDFEFIEPSTLRESPMDILARAASTASVKDSRSVNKQLSNIPRPSSVLLNDINCHAVTLDKPTPSVYSSSPSYYPTGSPEESESNSHRYRHVQTMSPAERSSSAQYNNVEVNSKHPNHAPPTAHPKVGEIQAAESHNVPNGVRVSPGLATIIERSSFEGFARSFGRRRATNGETSETASSLPASLSITAPKEIHSQEPVPSSLSDSMLINLSMTEPNMSFSISKAVTHRAASERFKAEISPRSQAHPADREFSAISVLIIVFRTAALIAIKFTLVHVGETMADELGQKISYGLLVGIGISVALAIRGDWYNNLWQLPQDIAFYIGKTVSVMVRAASDGYQVRFRQ